LYREIKDIKLAVKSIFMMLLLCLWVSAAGQGDSADATVGTVEVRVPDKSKIEAFKDDPRFNYAIEKQKEASISWWDRLKFEISMYIADLFNTVASSGALSFVVILLCVLLICLLLMKLIGVDYKTVLGRKKLDTPEIDIYTENVHEMNFDALISGALKNQDYRLAIRFIYLRNLKLLSDKEIITWSASKTNYSYRNEISSDNLRSKFLETTLIFDYVWYGEFPVEEVLFSEISGRMNSFSKMIADER
jgi:hypothetical protein